MRLCRFEYQGSTRVGFYRDEDVIDLPQLAAAAGVSLSESDSLLPFLSGGKDRQAVTDLERQVDELIAKAGSVAVLPLADVKVLVPVPDPRKLLLLAGNYSKHIEEGGGAATERQRTFPYVFMKPPTTTLTHPGDPVLIPEVSPDHIDWEIELAIIIGKTCHHVAESDALDYVAGYSVINDISDRQFRPNPQREERAKDGFFDWLHGKWHDTFCPMGPSVLPADECPDPQSLHLQLRLNGEVEQDSSTAEMVFPVAAVIEFVSQIVTLEPGDIISTGTPHGVGAAKGKFLRSGDVLEAEIERIGVLRNPVR